MGGSFEALVWAKNSRVGSHPAKLVLLMAADKVNERFELYPSKAELAHDCEMSKRTLDRWLRYLHEAGLMTLIERVRPNGSSGRMQMLINHPNAPHMRGEPIVLDHQGKHFYPARPQELRDAGLSWISGGRLNAECPKEAGREGGAGSAPRGVQDLQGGGAGSAPPGGAGSAPLNSNPQDLSNQTKAGPDESGPASAAGWLDQKPKQDETDPDGASLLRSLPLGIGNRLAGHAVRRWSHVVAAALRGGMEASVVVDRLTSGLESYSADRRVRILVGSRLPDLAENVKQASVQQSQREQCAVERAHAQINQMLKLGARGAHQAAGLLGEVWDPEPHRGEANAQEWLLKVQPALAREFIEARRERLVEVLTS